MATKVANTEGEKQSHSGTYFLTLVKKHQRKAVGGGVGVAIIAAGIWFTMAAGERRELFADRALQSARASVSVGNLPLAANDLSRVVSTYGGTPAGDEAAILLAHVRLLRNEAALAAAELRAFIQTGPPRHLVVSANALLGTALEQVGQMVQAARAYEAATDAARFPFMQAEYLADAARTYRAGGDSQSARLVYERIIEEFSETPSFREARMRLSELGGSE
ncbi:MAG: tetratricopeptide repeat protein [Gemmatimonadetes bacterium]|nr:tetratricopeptide repeat protein [Gemmatimonadota bacterium]